MAWSSQQLGLAAVDLVDLAHLWDSDRDLAEPVDTFLQEVFDRQLAENNGVEVGSIGDRRVFAFPTAFSAVRWATLIQDRLTDCSYHPGRLPEDLPVRVGVHHATVPCRAGRHEGMLECIGQPLRTVVELASVAHGHQVVLSTPAYEQIEPSERRELGVHFVALGYHRLRGSNGLRHLYEASSEKNAEQVFPASPAAVGRTNLRDERTVFLGRQRELEAIDRLMAASEGVVSIVGPAGVGKSRLARTFGFNARNRYAGVWLYDLTTARSEREVCVALLAALKTPALELSDQELRDRVVSTLADYSRDLHILDNLDRTAAVGASLLRRWLAAHPRARFLVTCRAPLSLECETPYRLEALSSNHGVELLAASARRARRSFKLSNKNRRLAANIVDELDGLPRALETAGAQVAETTLLEVRERLRRESPRKPRFVAHTPIELSNEMSWELLTPRERELLRFSGSFVHNFFENHLVGVASSNPDARGESSRDLLRALVRKSLLRCEAIDDRLGDIIFQPYRDTAELATKMLERSADCREVMRQHASVVVRSAEDWRRDTTTARRLQSIRRLTAYRDNIMAVISRFQDTECELACRAVLALSPTFLNDGLFAHHIPLLNRIIARLDDSVPPQIQAQLFQARAELLAATGRVGPAASDLVHAYALASATEDPTLTASVTCDLGSCQHLQHEISAALESFTAALDAVRSDDREARLIRARALRGRGVALAATNHMDAAEDSLLRAVHLQREVESPVEEAVTLVELGRVEQCFRRFGVAEGRLRRAVGIAREQQVGWLEGVARGALGAVMCQAGDTSGARSRLSLKRQKTDNPRWNGLVAGWCGMLEHRCGNFKRAVVYLEQSLESATMVGDAWRTGVVESLLGAVSASSGQIVDAEYHLKRARQSASLAEAAWVLPAFDFVEGLINLARADQAADHGDKDRAQAYFEQAASTAAARAPKRDTEQPIADADLAFGWSTLESEVERRRQDWDDVSRVEKRPVIRVAHDGSWYHVSGKGRFELGRRRTLRPLFAALVESHRNTPGRPLSSSHLIETVWGAEARGAKTASARLYVAIASLRKLGLRDVLIVERDGYLLEPDVVIEDD